MIRLNIFHISIRRCYVGLQFTSFQVVDLQPTKTRAKLDSSITVLIIFETRILRVSPVKFWHGIEIARAVSEQLLFSRTAVVHENSCCSREQLLLTRTAVVHENSCCSREQLLLTRTAVVHENSCCSREQLFMVTTVLVNNCSRTGRAISIHK